MTALRLLHVEDDPSDAALVMRQLRRDGLEVEAATVATESELREQLAGGPFDVVLSDSSLAGFDWRRALAIVQELAPDLPFIVVSGNIGEEEAVDALRAGAVDYVWKDRLARLVPAIRRALTEAEQRRLRVESEERFRLAVVHQLDAFTIYSAVRDAAGRIVDLRFEFVNQAACEFNRLTMEEQVGHGLLELFPDVSPELFARFAAVVETGEPMVADALEYDGAIGGEREKVYFDLRVIRHGDGCVASYRDVTQRQQAQERAAIMTRLYATLSRVNEAIVAADDRETLFRQVCEAAVVQGGAVMAWIGLVDEASGAVEVAASAGEQASFLDGIRVSVRDVPEGHGPTGRAIREGRHVLAPDLASDPSVTPWRAAALARGFASSASFPLHCGGRVIGAVSLYATQVRFFHAEEIELLDQLAADVSFALESLDRDAGRRSAEADRERSATLLAEGEELAGFGCWEWEPTHDTLTWSRGLARVLRSDGEPGWETLASAIGPEALAELRARWPAADLERLRDRESITAEDTVELAGEPVVLAITARAITDERGELVRVFGTVQDITERRRSERDHWLRSRLLDAVRAGVIANDADGRVIYWNPGAEALYGWTRDEALGALLVDLVVPAERAAQAAEVGAEIARSGAWQGVFEVRRKDGTVFPVLAHDTVFHDEHGDPQGIIGVSVDISDRVAAERDLRQARDFLGAVTESMGEGLFTLDANGEISYVNRAAQQMLGWEGDVLIGRRADEVILAGGDGDGESHSPLSRRSADGEAMQHVEELFVRQDGTLLPVSFTASPMTADGDDGRRGWVVVFTDDSQRRAERDLLEHQLEALGWVGRIRNALEDDDLVLYAQPIVDIPSGLTVQHELLVRMRSADGSIIPPAKFLPVAERYGLIKDLDRWVIDRGIGLAQRGHAVEINLSAASLGDREMASWLEERIRVSGVNPAQLVFEVTETALLSDEKAGRWFASRLQHLGCRLALDDFGTGYGGFTYLKQLHVDALKIDIEFVRDLCVNPASRHVVTAVVTLAKGFGVTTVAEGVEDEATLQALTELGVDMAQGFHLGRPAPVAEVFNHDLEVTG